MKLLPLLLVMLATAWAYDRAWEFVFDGGGHLLKPPATRFGYDTAPCTVERVNFIADRDATVHFLVTVYDSSGKRITARKSFIGPGQMMTAKLNPPILVRPKRRVEVKLLSGGGAGWISVLLGCKGAQ